MGKKKEKKQRGSMSRLQIKLIPVNIVVCIISLVAAISLYFMPLLTIDVGKIVGSEEVKTFATDSINKAIGNQTQALADEGDGNTQTPDTNTGAADFSSIMESVDIGAVLSPIAGSILGSIDGKVTLSVSVVQKIAFSQSPGEELIKLVLSDEKGLINQISTSLVKGVREAIKSDAVKTAFQDVAVTSVATAISSMLPAEYADVVNEEELREAVHKLDDVKSEEEAVKVVDEYLTKLEATGELGEMDAESKEEIYSQVRDMYQSTVEHTRDEEGNDNFSMEGFICVTASELMTDSGFDGGIDIGEMLEGMMGGKSEENPENSRTETRFFKASKYAAVDGEVSGGTDAETPSEGGDTPQNPPETEVSATIYTSYDQLLENIIIIPDDFDQTVNDTVTNALDAPIQSATETIDGMSAVFTGVYWGLTAFAIVWIILFAFSFFHLFFRNKRFTTWYVKIFGGIPCLLVFGGLKLAPVLLERFAGSMPAETLSLVKAALAGITTATWVSGICYILLWLVMLFWAFPIKHKIRKLLKSRK